MYISKKYDMKIGYEKYSQISYYDTLRQGVLFMPI